jgi:tRNA A37 threonylcarbamoyladenosine biosynthesis protein TsaE
LAPLHLETVWSDPHTLVCVEWPSKLGSVLPQDALSITFSPTSEEEREVSGNPDFEAYFGPLA